MMRVLVAPDSFKGSLCAAEAAEAMALGVRDAWPDCETLCVPLADGGEGTADVLSRAWGCRWVYVWVHDPLGRPVRAWYGMGADGVTAVLDVASASGLTLVEPELRDPLRASSYGTGELIAAAVCAGARHVVVGLGGSATVDGGRGLLEGLGYVFDGGVLDGRGRLPELAGVRFTCACDVVTPMCGPDGAVAVFGPQKGVTAVSAPVLEGRMVALAAAYGGVGDMPRGGAAGGIGGALAGVCGAELCAGIDVVLDAVGFAELAAEADLIVTGEGCVDCQSLLGKTVGGVLSAGRAVGVPVVAVGGLVRWCSGLADAGFADVVQAMPDGMDVAEAMRPEVASMNLRRAVMKLKVGG